MKMFYLNRLEDESGVTVTGRVAQGFIFDNTDIMKSMMDKMTDVLKIMIPGVKGIIHELRDVLKIKLDEILIVLFSF